jgi:hypothetical protein
MLDNGLQHHVVLGSAWHGQLHQYLRTQHVQPPLVTNWYDADSIATALMGN